MVMTLRALCLCPLLVALSGVAWADVIHLKNGRTMEGEITRTTSDAVHLRVRGGKMVLPLSVVDRIEERARPQDEFAERVRRVDSADPDALERLALWASSRGLGQESQNLNAHADGIRLQRRVDSVRGTRRAQDWVDVYRWAKHRRLSGEVQEWLLDQAESIDADHLGLRTARRERALAAEEVERLATEKAERSQNYRQRRSARIAQRNREKAERAEAERVSRLEAQLAEQQARIEELEQRSTRSVIRRRRRPGGGGLVVPGLPYVQPLPCPTQPVEPPPPPVSIRGG